MTDRTDDFKFIAAALPPPARVSPPPPKVRRLPVCVCACVCVRASYLASPPLKTRVCRAKPAPLPVLFRVVVLTVGLSVVSSHCTRAPELYEDNTWSVSIVTSTNRRLISRSVANVCAIVLPPRLFWPSIVFSFGNCVCSAAS